MIKLPTIKIRKDKNCYTAIFIDGLPKIQVIAEFNVNELSTAFSKKALFCDVIRAIRKLNPDCNVIFN